MLNKEKLREAILEGMSSMHPPVIGCYEEDPLADAIVAAILEAESVEDNP